MMIDCVLWLLVVITKSDTADHPLLLFVRLQILPENYFFKPKEVWKVERIVGGWNVIGNRTLIERKEDCRRSKSKEEDSSIHLC